MARKTKRPRTTRPSATASESGPETIDDAETGPAAPIEDAEIVPEREAADTGEAPAPEEGSVPPVPTDPVTLSEPLSPADARPIDDAATGETDEPVEESDAPLVGATGDDTVPPEEQADLADLARMDGADPVEMEIAAEADATGSASDEGDLSSDEDLREEAHAEVVEPSAPAPLPATQPHVVEKSGPGFVPLVLGGLVAGAIGYAIPTFLAPEAEGVDPAALAALEQRIDALPSGDVDLSAIEAAQAEMGERVDAMSARIDALEAGGGTAAEQSAGASTAQPAGDGEALAALRAEVEGLDGLRAEVDDLAALRPEVEALSGVTADLDALSARVDALAAQVEAMPAPPADMSDRVAALEAELAALDEETTAVETSAEELARQAAANQVRIAVDSGVPYAEPLAVIGDAPAVLADNAETGLPTDDSLAAAFPDAARAALAEARRVTPEGSGLGAFIRRSTGARSLEPREGDDADAVLSRAGAAIEAGDVDGALAEIEALPPEAQDAMAGWIAEARTRAEARAALTDYLGTE